MAADLCASCGLTAAAYTCPKCRARTCCLPCYRAHNEGLCAAEFATATVKEQLAATFAPPSDRQHVLAALRRLNEDDGGGDEVAEAHSDGDDEVLARLDSSRTASDLTDEERRALARQFGKEGVRDPRPPSPPGPALEKEGVRDDAREFSREPRSEPSLGKDLRFEKRS